MQRRTCEAKGRKRKKGGRRRSKGKEEEEERRPKERLAKASNEGCSVAEVTDCRAWQGSERTLDWEQRPQERQSIIL